MARRREINMEKNTTYAVVLLVIVALIGAVYWLLKGYVTSSELQGTLLEQYRWLGAALTIVLICVVGYVLNKVHKEE